VRIPHARCILRSALLRILALLAVNLLLIQADGSYPSQEDPSIRVFFSETDQADESLKADVSSTDRFARLLEPAEHMLPKAPGKAHQRDPSSDRVPRQSGSTRTWLSTRILLLSGTPLNKYAKFPSLEMGRSSRPHRRLNTVISLNAKDIRYLSCFPHIKHTIEQVWSYPTEVVTGGAPAASAFIRAAA
jgi:hypothetical protein